VGWDNVVQDTLRWQAVVKTGMKYYVPHKRRTSSAEQLHKGEAIPVEGRGGSHIF
jgi:hypothetical protein